jgi:hypothetical protein
MRERKGGRRGIIIYFLAIFLFSARNAGNWHQQLARHVGLDKYDLLMEVPI